MNSCHHNGCTSNHAPNTFALSNPLFTSTNCQANGVRACCSACDCHCGPRCAAGQPNPPCPPCPPCPSCPTCPACPPCPVPEFPAVVCTPAFESFSDQLLQIPATAVVIPNAFTSNDGPAPYTLLEASFVNLQLPMSGLTFTPLGNNRYALSASVAPMVQVSYLDGNLVARAKFVQATMPLTGTVTSSVDPGTVVWWAFMQSGSISNPILSGTTLSFTATAAVDVIAIPSVPSSFAVLQGFTCVQQAPVQAQCRSIYPLESYCQLLSIIPGSVFLAIPFIPLGPPPYTSPTVTALGGQPYVLRVVPQAGDVAMIDLAFPVILRYMDGGGQVQTQDSFLFMPLLMSGIADGPGTRVIANLAVADIVPSGEVTPPVLRLQTVVLFGNIATVDAQTQVLVTDAVQCGEASATACQPILPPPTAEITG